MMGGTARRIGRLRVGTRPFAFLSYQPDATIRYTANPSYRSGRPKIDIWCSRSPPMRQCVSRSPKPVSARSSPSGIALEPRRDWSRLSGDAGPPSTSPALRERSPRVSAAGEGAADSSQPGRALAAWVKQAAALPGWLPWPSFLPLCRRLATGHGSHPLPTP